MLSNIETNLKPLLSSEASITAADSVTRWSEYAARTSGAVINVATEQDVSAAVSVLCVWQHFGVVTTWLSYFSQVKYCVQNDLQFRAYSGGNGWDMTSTIDQNSVIINLRGLSSVSFNASGTEATVQGGTNAQDVIDAAYALDIRMPTVTCNTVGYLAAVLGGGLSRLLGMHGPGVDQLLSVNIVTATGDILEVNEDKDTDLWWAIRGAGHNFGIVTSARVKAYPFPRAENTAWRGPLIFTGDKLEALVSALDNLDLTPRMQVYLTFVSDGPSNPAIMLLPFYLGDEAAGRAAFASMLDIGPVSDQTEVVPYDQWNIDSSPFCTKGGRKPCFSVSMKKLDPAACRSAWDLYVEFLKNPGTSNSAVMVECFSTYVAQWVPASATAFPFRDLKYHAMWVPWYDDPALDDKAVELGDKVRQLWRSTDGLDAPCTFVPPPILSYPVLDLVAGNKSYTDS